MMRNVASTKARIADAAGALFYRRGVRATSVDDVAAAAGVTKRTLYLHYGSKDALLDKYLAARDAAVFERIVGDAGDGPAETRIALIFDRIGARARNRAWRGCPFVRIAHEQPDELRAVAGAHKARLERWFAALFRHERLRNPGALARQMMILLDGTVSEILIRDDPRYAADAKKAALLLVANARRR
jgi:AcrR family transcriptional regulator